MSHEEEKVRDGRPYARREWRDGAGPSVPLKRGDDRLEGRPELVPHHLRGHSLAVLEGTARVDTLVFARSLACEKEPQFDGCVRSTDIRMSVVLGIGAVEREHGLVRLEGGAVGEREDGEVLEQERGGRPGWLRQRRQRKDVPDANRDRRFLQHQGVSDG